MRLTTAVFALRKSCLKKDNARPHTLMFPHDSSGGFDKREGINRRKTDEDIKKHLLWEKH
jgi:hypothetical protein